MAANKGYSAEDYWAAYQRLGSQNAVAREMGVVRSTVQDAIKKYKSDPALAEAAKAVGTNMVPTLAWAKTKPDENGMAYSVLLKPVSEDRDFMADLREAFEGMEPAAPIEPPDHVMDDLCTVYPLMDVHLGMLADSKETGGDDYNLKRALADMRLAFAKVLALTPQSAEAVLIIGGDFLHANSHEAVTPAHKHHLDVDTRHWKVLEAGVEMLKDVIETISMRHQRITVKVLRGNHDPESHLVMAFALAERYRLSSHVTIDKSPQDIFMKKWGRCLISAHHGDKAPPERLAFYISDICDFWSETRHRHIFTGHVHKDQTRDLGPIKWHSLRAFAPPDAYSAGAKYSGRRAIQAMTFDMRDGLILQAFDPIDLNQTP